MPWKLRQISTWRNARFATIALVSRALHGHGAAKAMSLVSSPGEHALIFSWLTRVPVVRCSLTFLAIQAPGISKLCGICGKRYLNEEYLRKTDRLIRSGGNRQSEDGGQQDVVMRDADGGQEEPILPSTETDGTGEGNAKQGEETAQGGAGASSNDGRSPITLARILFSACDVCFYCGGKFMG